MPGGTEATPSCLTTIYSHWQPETSTRLDELLRDRLQKSLRATLHMARRRGSGDPPGEPTLDINIAEPAVFLPTYTNNPAVLRGTCTLELKEPLVVKRLMVNFRGVSHVLWPHGFREKRTITNCNFTVFDPEKSTARETRCNSCASTDSENLPVAGPPSQKRCKLWYALMDRMKLSRESESRRLSPGTYTYEFEMILPTHLPETINVRRSHVNYNIRACVTTSGFWNRKIIRDKQITAVHCPAENFVDDAEPVYITRTWRKLLRCEIIISRRGAALGRTLPLTVSFAELNMAKVRGIQIYLLENVQYLGRSGTVSCLGPYKRVRIYEAMDDLVPAVSRRSSADDSHPSDEEREDLFGKEKKDPERMAESTGMEGTTLEIDLPLPVCMVHSNEPRGMQNKTMHFDTRYKNVHVHHWFEFVFFASKNGSSDTPPVQKSTKAPFLLRSCFAHQANASLPAYTQNLNGKQSCTDCLIEYTE